MVGDREGYEADLAAELVVSALGDELTAACARALAQHRDPRLDELLERVAAIENRLPPLLFPISDAARQMKVSVATIKRRVRDGSLPTLKVGSRTLVDLSRLRGVDGDEVARLAVIAAAPG